MVITHVAIPDLRLAPAEKGRIHNILLDRSCGIGTNGDAMIGNNIMQIRDRFLFIETTKFLEDLAEHIFQKLHIVHEFSGYFFI